MYKIKQKQKLFVGPESKCGKPWNIIFFSVGNSQHLIKEINFQPNYILLSLHICILNIELETENFGKWDIRNKLIQIYIQQGKKYFFLLIFHFQVVLYIHFPCNKF